MKKIVFITLLCIFAFTFISCSQSLSDEEVLTLAQDILKDQGKTIVDQAKWEEYQSVETMSNSTEPEPTPTPTATLEPEIGTRKKPLSIGESCTVQLDSYNGNCDIEIKLTEVITGDDAWDIIKNANRFNDAPQEGQEYIMAKFSVKNVKDLTGDDEPLDLSSSLFDYADSQDAIVDQRCSVASVEPDIDALLYEGSEHEGWVQFFANIGETNPKVVFNDNVWFSLKGDVLSSDATSEDSPADDTDLVDASISVLNTTYEGMATFTADKENKYYIMDYTDENAIGVVKKALDGDEASIDLWNQIFKTNFGFSKSVYDNLNYKIVATCSAVTDQQLAILEGDKITYNFADNIE